MEATTAGSPMNIRVGQKNRSSTLRDQVPLRGTCLCCVLATGVAIGAAIAEPTAGGAPNAARVEFSNPGAFFTFIGPRVEGASQLEWPVTLNLTYLETLPATAVVNFPDRAAATLSKGRAEIRGAGAFLWTGNGAGCSAVLNVAPTSVFGLVSCLTGNYGILGDPSGQSGHLTLIHSGIAVAPIPSASPPALLSMALFILSFGLVAQARAGSRGRLDKAPR